MSIRTEPIRKQHYQSASKLLADAFYDNPAHEYICPDSSKRISQLNWLLGANLNLQLQNGVESFCVTNNENVTAMGYWTNPYNKIALYKKIRIGLLRAPIILGLNNFIRMMSVSHHIEESILNLDLNKPHWYLNNMVVGENLRGQGIGTKILKQEIKKIKTNQPRAVFSLTTQKNENVEFYKRHGFEVALEENKLNDGCNFPNWIMCRE